MIFILSVFADNKTGGKKVPDEKDDKKVQLAIYVEPTLKENIDNFIFDKRIRNFQDAYRKIVELGFIEFKKTGGKTN